MSTRTIEVTVRLEFEDWVDPAELVSDMDYTFSLKDGTLNEIIKSTEIIDVNTEN